MTTQATPASQAVEAALARISHYLTNDGWKFAAMAAIRTEFETLASQQVAAPVGITSIDDMCAILKRRYIKASEYTDCAILYEVTFDQLRALYDEGRAATPPGGAGGSVGASREQDSFHVVNAESGLVQGAKS